MQAALFTIKVKVNPNTDKYGTAVVLRDQYPSAFRYFRDISCNYVWGEPNTVEVIARDFDVNAWREDLEREYFADSDE